MSNNITNVRYPDYLLDSLSWQEWRDTFCGGNEYRERYLTKTSDRETDAEYQARKRVSPITAFAKAAVLDVRNSIYQRLEDVLRVGGSPLYKKAAAGEGGGVDRKGSSMSAFIGRDVLTELLVMGRCGVFVDSTATGEYTTLAGQSLDRETTPFVYYYPVEDILSYTFQRPDRPGQFKSILLRDQITEYYTDHTCGIVLPQAKTHRFRLLWIDDTDGYVYYKIFNKDGDLVRNNFSDLMTGATRMDFKEIPFIMPDIMGSLLKDVASYQHALLNLASRDGNFALQANFPFLVIQEDSRTNGSHLKQPSESGVSGSQLAESRREEFGSTRGRYYDIATDAPQFIAPSSENLEASMKLQEKWEDDIRRLINLAVENKSGSRTESAEAKKLSSQGLEAGLSFIGLVLEKTEQAIAKYWAMYENIKTPNTAFVSYPSRYILQTDGERIEAAKALAEVMKAVPGDEIKVQTNILIATTMYADKVPTDTLQKIIAEIKASKSQIADSETMLACQKAGLVSDETASRTLGFAEGEVEQAKKDQAERAAMIQEAQAAVAQQRNGPGGGATVARPAARGVPQADPNPNSAVEEKAEVKAKKEAGE